MAKRKKRFSGTPAAHRRDAEVFLRNTRSAAKEFNRLLKDGNCGAAYHELIKAHLRGAEYKLSKEYASGKKRPSKGSVSKLIGMSRRFQRTCIRTRWEK